MAILNNSNAISTAGGYDINNSLRFRSSASAYLKRTPASAGNRQTWTWSGWVKRGALGSSQQIFASDNSSTSQARLGFTSSDTLSFISYIGAMQIQLVTTQVFRDPSAWYHIVLVLDTTNATSSNRTKIYVNGAQVTALGTATYSAQNYNGVVNDALAHFFGTFYNATSGEFLDGYLAEVNFIDGQALTASSFGETDTTTGAWKPKAYTGTYGTNGFYLKFSDIATTSGSNAGLGKDFSGNTNYWNTNNISVTSGVTYDAMKDSPTLTSTTVANYAVLNQLDNTAVLSEANLKITYTGAATWHAARGSIYVSSGKWYWEVNVVQVGYLMIGVASPSFSLDNTYGTNTYNWTYFQSNGNKYGPGIGGSGSAYGASYTAGDVIGVALDMDAGTLTFYKNNTSQGTAFTGITGLVAPVIALDNETGSGGIAAINFGQRPFSYSAPSGYVALNTYNLPDSTIVKGNKYMDATTYTGTGSALTVTNASSFKPDFVWIKSRSNAYSHGLFDSVRGALKVIQSQSTAAEATETAGTSLTGFNSNGFALGTNGGTVSTNVNGATFVGWQWQAGQGSTSSNTSGSITSTVSVNTTAGFSIVTFTGNATAGSTVGHGLGVAPKFVIYKARNNGNDWWSYHVGLTSAAYAIQLNTTNAQNNTVNFFNSTAPSATVLTLGYWNNVTGFNLSTQNYVAYCWAEIAGFSKFGSYTGNGSTDGPFVYTGFRPKYILRKCATDPGYGCRWEILDTSRNTYNQANSNLSPNYSNAEDSTAAYWGTDILSNGFKLRNTDTEDNVSGQTYIYAAFAENPFKNANAR